MGFNRGHPCLLCVESGRSRHCQIPQLSFLLCLVVACFGTLVTSYMDLGLAVALLFWGQRYRNIMPNHVQAIAYLSWCSHGSFHRRSLECHDHVRVTRFLVCAHQGKRCLLVHATKSTGTRKGVFVATNGSRTGHCGRNWTCIWPGSFSDDGHCFAQRSHATSATSHSLAKPSKCSYFVFHGRSGEFPSFRCHGSGSQTNLARTARKSNLVGQLYGQQRQQQP